MAIPNIHTLVLILLCPNVVLMAKVMSPSSTIIQGEDTSEDLRCTGQSCASGCSCSCMPHGSGGLLVNCSYRGLTDIPHNLPANTEELWLDHNRIGKLGGEAFQGCSGLIRLDLSDNMLAEIAGNSFNGLRQLEHLYLERSTRKELKLPVDAFKELTTLKKLDLQQVYISDFGKLIGNLTKLQTLMISISQDNWRAAFETISLKLVQLQVLWVDCMYVQLGNYSFYSFQNSSIKVLLMQCMAEGQDVSRYSFFPHLETLDLGYAIYSNPKNISRFWPGLGQTNVSELLLRHIFSKPTKLVESFYRGLRETHLLTLTLDYNFIVSIGRYSWLVKYLPDLKHLSLRGNAVFMPGDAFRCLAYHTHLTYLGLNEAVWILPAEAVDNTSNPVGSHARLSSDVSGLKEDCPVSDNSFGDGKLNVKLPDSLEILYISRKGYNAGVPAQVSITASPSLQKVQCEFSNLRSISSFLTIGDRKPVFKIKLSLINNQLTYIDDEFGETAGNVTGSLMLPYNELGHQLSGDSTGRTFGNFTELTELDLSYNMIKTLHRDVFRAQEKLQNLTLAQNNLQLLQFSFLHMNLTHLDLASNLFSQLSEYNCNDLDALSHKLNHTVFLSLAENPLQCSCETLDFLQWCLHTKINFTDWQSMACVYHDSVVNLTTLMSNIIPELNVSCRGNIWLIASSVTLGLILLMIVISVFLYRHRFEVRFALLNLVIKRKKYDALREEEDYAYDAFVAFDMADVDWVRDILLPKLEQEGERRFRLCVHQRDFIGGTPIVENIADAICSSRKVIVILTKHFLASSWCQFELETTQIRSFEEGKDLIVPVLMEELPVVNMSKTLRVLLRRNTYITWPEQQQEMENFWRALRRALDTKSSKIIRCQCGNNINL